MDKSFDSSESVDSNSSENKEQKEVKAHKSKVVQKKNPKALIPKHKKDPAISNKNKGSDSDDLSSSSDESLESYEDTFVNPATVKPKEEEKKMDGKAASKSSKKVSGSKSKSSDS